VRMVKKTYRDIRLVQFLVKASQRAILPVRPVDRRRIPCSQVPEPRMACYAFFGSVPLSKYAALRQDHHDQTTAGVRAWREERAPLVSALNSRWSACQLKAAVGSVYVVRRRWQLFEVTTRKNISCRKGLPASGSPENQTTPHNS